MRTAAYAYGNKGHSGEWPFALAGEFGDAVYGQSLAFAWAGACKQVQADLIRAVLRLSLR